MMKTPFRLMTIGLIATSLLASCKKNNNDNNGGTANGQGFKATIEQGVSNNTRTHINGLNPTEGGSSQVLWDEADLIKVRNAEGTVLNYELTEGANTTEGTFYTGEDHDDFFQPSYTAIYPAFNADEVANTITGNGTARFTLPATQTYVANSFAKGAMPMVAYSENQTLQFKNTLGGIGFPLKGAGIHINKIVLTSNNVDDKLWGVFNVDCTSANPIPQYVSGGSNVIELTCDIDLTDVEQVFYIMVPPATMSTGFNVKVYSGNTVYYDKTADWTASPQDNFMERRIVKVLSDVIPVTSPLQVTVNSPTWITTNSAKTGASVTGGNFSTLGVIYAKMSDLSDIDNDLVLGGAGVTELVTTTNGTVVSDMTGLDINTIYYVRAYAKTPDRSVEMTYYSDPIPFATRRDYFSSALNGKMPFDFTVAPGRTINFSVGNLQYRASTNTWKFAEYQYYYIGAANMNVSPTYDGWIDVFGWGTSGYDHGAVCYQPWSNDHEINDYTKYYAYGDDLKHLYEETGKADWGYNRISNGGNTEGQWRTLTGGPDGEWLYLFDTRSGWRYSFVNVNVRDGEIVNSVILYPDGFSWPTTISDQGVTVTYNEKAHYSSNPLTEAQWSLLEEKGCVMLPPSGGRTGLWGRCCYYWASTRYHNPATEYYIRQADCVDLQSNYMSVAYWHDRFDAYAVRLVRVN